MPNKEATELQLLRLLSNSPLQLEISFIRLATHKYKNVSTSYLNTYYKPFDEIKDIRFDGLIITGAPVEKLEYEQVDYWDELAGIMEWSKTYVTSSLYICWAAQAGLYYHYGIPKHEYDKKLSGIYLHRLTDKTNTLVRGFDDEFYAPHSRYTGVRTEGIGKHKELNILAESDTAGAYIISDGKNIFVNGHPEYDADTLAGEYIRDTKLNLNPLLPENYFPDDDPGKAPIMRWRSQGNLLFSNWLDYYVYQLTPYHLDEAKK
jgi:homoserine O-succinyltransferase